MTLVALEPLHILRPAGDIHVRAGRCFELSDDEGTRLLLKAPESVRVVQPEQRIRPGDWVSWMSPALPAQEGDVLGIHPDGTFEAFHPLAESVRRMPVSWITRVTRPTNMEGQS